MTRRTAKKLGSEVLATETLAALDEGLQSEATGRDLSWEEVEKDVRQQRKAWKTLPDNMNA